MKYLGGGTVGSKGNREEHVQICRDFRYEVIPIQALWREQRHQQAFDVFSEIQKGGFMRSRGEIMMSTSRLLEMTNQKFIALLGHVKMAREFGGILKRLGCFEDGSSEPLGDVIILAKIDRAEVPGDQSSSVLKALKEASEEADADPVGGLQSH